MQPKCVEALLAFPGRGRYGGIPGRVVPGRAPRWLGPSPCSLIALGKWECDEEERERRQAANEGGVQVVQVLLGLR